MRTILFILFLTSIFSCKNEKQQEVLHLDIAKEEIRAVELNFVAMAEKEGIKKAFLEFSTSDAVLMRGPKLIKGHEEMNRHFDQNTNTNEHLKWEVEFVDVAASADMAYTYGPFVYDGISSTGDSLHYEGYFHTVWKRQEDGKWKFVWD